MRSPIEEIPRGVRGHTWVVILFFFFFVFLFVFFLL